MRAWLACLLILLAVPVHGASRQTWGIEKTDEAVHLYYGVPESDSVTIAFVCKTRTKQIEIVSTILPEKSKKGEPITTILSNGTVTNDYDGKVVGEDADDLHVEAVIPADRKVTEVLKSGRSMSIRVRGRLERVPLRGAAKPLVEFEKLCFG